MLFDVRILFWLILKLIYNAIARLENILCAGVSSAESSPDLCRPVAPQVPPKWGSVGT